MKICILYGGTSSERAVSLNTGESIYNAISNEYQVTRHDFNGNYSKFYDQGEEKITNAEDYNSHNTNRLDIEDMKSILKKLPFIQATVRGELTDLD